MDHNIIRLSNGGAGCTRCGADTAEELCKECPAISDGRFYAVPPPDNAFPTPKQD